MALALAVYLAVLLLPPLLSLKQEAIPKSAQGQWWQVSASSPWSPRDGAGLLSLNGALYMLGGWNTAWPVPHTTNEVWTSNNGGATWSILPTPPWERRHASAWLVHDGKLWVIGGDVNSGHYQRDIWSSPNGINWTQVSANAAPLSMGRTLHMSFSHAGKLWIVGGQTLDEFTPGDISTKPGSPFYSDVWSSADGIVWTKVSDNNAWAPRGVIINGVVKDGHMWLIAGGAYDTEGNPRVYKNDVWKSADGINWTQVTANAGFAPRQFNNVGVLGDDLVVMAGWDEANRNDVWASPDGITWRQLPAVPWGIRHAASLVTHNDEFVLLGGPLTDTAVWAMN